MIDKAPRITPAFSAYLDVLRGGSALAVALSHLELFGILKNQPVWPHNAHDAVVVFFVLSGFLVAYACAAKPEQGLGDYALDRASRILSVAVPILALSFLAAAMGWITPEPGYQVDKAWFYFPFFLSFLNQSWLFREIPLDLYPWWSLPFEVFYYAVFGCALFLRGPLRWIMAGGLFLLMGPRLWMLFPVWLCGAAVMAALHIQPARWIGYACVFVPLIILVVFKIYNLDQAIHYWTLIPWGYNGNARPFGNASYFLADYITGPLVAVHLYGVAHMLRGFPEWLVRPVQMLAGVSFTLYLLHPLIYRVMTDSFGLKNVSLAFAMILFFLTTISCFAVAPFTEYRRKDWRRALLRLAHWPHLLKQAVNK
jgi:peptidoglycan/LPS O-acetylase OafA/YrhL